MSDSDSDADSTFYHHGAAVAAQQHYQQQQEEEVGWDWGAGGLLPALEIRSVKLHPSGSHLAVGVRRQGVCAVDVYTLPPRPGAAAAEAAVSPDMSTTSSELLGGQARDPYVVALRTNASSGAASSRPAAAAAAAATASAAATADLSTARLSWVLALEEPTLVLDVIGLVTPQSHGVLNPSSSPAAAAAAQSDSWLVVSVSGITSPTAVYYVNLTDPQQQIKVRWEGVNIGMTCCRL